jgi:hypothetical protein
MSEKWNAIMLTMLGAAGTSLGALLVRKRAINMTPPRAATAAALGTRPLTCLLHTNPFYLPSSPQRKSQQRQCHAGLPLTLIFWTLLF